MPNEEYEQLLANDLLHYGTILKDNQITNKLGFIRIQLISYKSMLFYLERLNGIITDLEKVANINE